MMIKTMPPVGAGGVVVELVVPISEGDYCTDETPMSTGIISPRTCDFLLPLLEPAERLAATDTNLPRRKKHAQLALHLAATIRLSLGRLPRHGENHDNE